MFGIKIVPPIRRENNLLVDSVKENGFHLNSHLNCLPKRIPQAIRT